MHISDIGRVVDGSDVPLQLDWVNNHISSGNTSLLKLIVVSDRSLRAPATKAGADPRHEGLFTAAADDPHRRPPYAAQYQYTSQDVDLSALQQWAPKVQDKLNTIPGLEDVASDLQLASPQLKIERLSEWLDRFGRSWRPPDRARAIARSPGGQPAASGDNPRAACRIDLALRLCSRTWRG